MRVLVTGGTGFVGSHTVAAWSRQATRCGCWVRAAQPVAPAVAPLGLQAGDLDRIVGDVTDPAVVDQAVAGCQAVVRAGSVYSLDTRDAGPASARCMCAAVSWCWGPRSGPGWTRSCTSPAWSRCYPQAARPLPQIARSATRQALTWGPRPMPNGSPAATSRPARRW